MGVTRKLWRGDRRSRSLEPACRSEKTLRNLSLAWLSGQSHLNDLRQMMSVMSVMSVPFETQCCGSSLWKLVVACG